MSLSKIEKSVQEAKKKYEEKKKKNESYIKENLQLTENSKQKMLIIDQIKSEIEYMKNKLDKEIETRSNFSNISNISNSSKISKLSKLSKNSDNNIDNNEKINKSNNVNINKNLSSQSSNIKEGSGSEKKGFFGFVKKMFK